MVSVLLSNIRMKTSDEIRWENLLLLIDEAGGVDALAGKFGCSPGYIRQLKAKSKDSETGKPKGIGNSTARGLEICMEKPKGWLDQNHGAESREAYEGTRPTKTDRHDDFNKSKLIAAVKALPLEKARALYLFIKPVAINVPAPRPLKRGGEIALENKPSPAVSPSRKKRA